MNKDTKTNIILFLADQQRFDTVNEEVMPNLSYLASFGTFFTDCYTCQPVCGPARACLQSGAYATETGCFINGISLPQSGKYLAHYLGENGYNTAYIGKWHLASDNKFDCATSSVPKERLGGYSYFRGADVLEFTSDSESGYIFDEDGNRIDFKGYRADCITDFALEYIKKTDKTTPFFMMVSTLEPHHQNNEHRFRGYKETVANYKDYPLPEDLRGKKGDAQKEYPDYISSINRLDYNIGRLCDKLKEQGIYDNTVIIYTADHGCHFKTRNGEYKRSCHDSSIHIPLVIGGGMSAFSGGREDSRLVSLVDIPYTVLSIAGINVPDCFKGINLLTKDERDCVFVQISESQCGRAIRTRDYKYSVCVPTPLAGVTMKDSPVYTEEFLYYLKNDPYEQNNLINKSEYASVKSILRKKLLEQIKLAEDKNAKIVSKSSILETKQ